MSHKKNVEILQGERKVTKLSTDCHKRCKYIFLCVWLTSCDAAEPLFDSLSPF